MTAVIALTSVALNCNFLATEPAPEALEEVLNGVLDPDFPMADLDSTFSRYDENRFLNGWFWLLRDSELEVAIGFRRGTMRVLRVAVGASPAWRDFSWI